MLRKNYLKMKILLILQKNTHSFFPIFETGIIISILVLIGSKTTNITYAQTTCIIRVGALDVSGNNIPNKAITSNNGRSCTTDAHGNSCSMNLGGPGTGCCIGPCGCLEICLPGLGQNGIFVTNHCSGTIGDIRIEGDTPIGRMGCGPFNLRAGSTVNVCMEYGPYYNAHATDGKAGGACLIKDPSRCCPANTLDLCDI